MLCHLQKSLAPLWTHLLSFFSVCPLSREEKERYLISPNKINLLAVCSFAHHYWYSLHAVIHSVEKNNSLNYPDLDKWHDFSTCVRASNQWQIFHWVAFFYFAASVVKINLKKKFITIVKFYSTLLHQICLKKNC